MPEELVGVFFEIADLLRFSHTATSTVYRERSRKEKISSEQHSLDENALVMPEVKLF